MAKKQYSSTKLVLSKVSSIGEWEENMTKTFAKEAVTALKEELNPGTFDLIFIALGPREEVVSIFPFAIIYIIIIIITIISPIL